LGHFELKSRHLVASILMTFLRNTPPVFFTGRKLRRLGTRKEAAENGNGLTNGLYGPAEHQSKNEISGRPQCVLVALAETLDWWKKSR